MPDKPRSVLDSIPVVDKAFPLRQYLPEARQESLEIVGACPVCGAPIYGSRAILPSAFPTVVYSCTCTPPPIRSKTIQETMETK